MLKHMATSFQSVAAVLSKDVQSELRVRYAINALVMFILTSVSTILFALRYERPTPTLFAGLYWVVVFFSAMSGLSRAFVGEEERGTSLTLRLIATPAAIYAGKLVANTILTLLLASAVTVLYLLTFPGFSVQSYDIFVVTVLLGAVGIAAATTILAAMIAKAQARGALFPVLSFPVLIPLFMTVLDATDKALSGDDFGEAFGDFQVLAGYAMVMIAGSALLFAEVWND